MNEVVNAIWRRAGNFGESSGLHDTRRTFRILDNGEYPTFAGSGATRDLRRMPLWKRLFLLSNALEFAEHHMSLRRCKSAYDHSVVKTDCKDITP